ncbi:Holliday junction DNA helicase RuvA [Tessaracoccus lapidicaptus]|uniref:Holliday junction branch migration complex subunit RuvA n=1 Tax=Tessaracoccus lapidicaptus TaxID=1427523 RepID=A0A1C0ANC0_9ACTN|nr:MULTISPECIES: Holliday junction branch migration protein RuvA [Tessaracoccus]AQX14668.1 Holliday junction branch migration protein RuvA [Tessaracoccus sp. T2.5-30]OCL34672.1 Holliday junction DNA helicase RuvA [Tessaracoccus lapidicaptus]VEP38730.1 Holliday junction ATP-dependent DNA helicase RuvA [Tessaracoccus lapidicaptus]
MIAQLTGTVLTAGATSAVVDVGGVGFLVATTPQTAAGLRPGEVATLHTALVVREDSMTLFGFAEPAEREAFELAQTASGVGPKLALAIVSVLAPGELKRAVLAEDLNRLCSVPGIGRKGAQKLVIELKDRVLVLEDAPGGPAPVAAQDAWRAQVAEGLQGLGWSARDADAACDAVAHLVDADPDISMALLLRAALNSLARR